ncbi:MAG: hypothetical protein ACM4D3_24565 [Candidatus Sericytochromatia bacterium]
MRGDGFRADVITDFGELFAQPHDELFELDADCVWARVRAA